MPTILFLIGLPGIIAIVISVALFLVGLIIASVFLYKRRFSVNSNHLRKTYDLYHSQLVTDCDSMIKRLCILGEHSETFLAAYQERKKQYDDLLSRRDKDVLSVITRLETLVANRNYKEYRNVEGECQKAVAAFESAVSHFNTDLNSLLQDDNDIHSNSVHVKAKYREISQFYLENEINLKPLEKSFEKIFETSEAKFSQFDICSNQAQFDECKKILDELDMLFTAVLAVLKDLPLLEVSISTVLPQKIDNVYSEYEKMIQEGYVVNQGKITTNINSMRNRLVQLQNQMLCLDTRNVKESIDAIQNEITDLSLSFSAERQAKETYLNSQNKIADSSFAVEKRYARLINLLPECEKVYVLDQQYVTQLKTLRSDVEQIGILKRELDSYINTSAKQPYVVITKKMQEMDSEMSKAISVMDQFESYLASLKEDATNVFSGLRDCYVNLVIAQKSVAQLDVVAYYNATKDIFAADYKKIKEINTVVLTQPINVPQALSLYKPFKFALDGFIEGINSTIQKAQYAEEAIKKANLYRMDYADSRQPLLVAEQSFQEGNFDKALSLAQAVIKTFSADRETDN